MRCWLVTAVLGAVAMGGCAARSDPGAVLLERARVASTQTDYGGLMLSRVLTGGHWITSEVDVHFHKPGLSRFEYLTPPMQGVIVARARGFTWRFEPSTHKVFVTRGAMPHDQSKESLTEQNYRVVVSEHMRLANRDVLVMDVLPKNPGNPWKRYWIDQKTDVILGWAHYTAGGAAESVSQFQKVEFTPQPDSLFDPPQARARVLNPIVYQPMSLSQLQARVGFRVDEPTWLPPGYAVQSYILTSCEDGCGEPVAMTRYSDGVNSVSIFQCPIVKPVHTRADDHIVRAFRNNMNYVAVGDLGTAALKRMLDSIAARTPASSTYRPPTPPPH